MSEPARAPAPELPEPPGWRDLRRQVADTLARVNAMTDSPEAVTDQERSLIITGLRHGAAQLDRIVFAESDFRRAVAEAVDAIMRRPAGAHRKPPLRGIRGGRWKGAAVSGPAALKIAGALTATAASIAIAAPALPSLPSLPAGHHAQAFGGLSPTVALPAVTPSPLRSYAPRHAKPSPDAATVSPVPVPPVAVVASPPSVSSVAPSVVASGNLNAVTMQLSVGLDGRGQISFGATGGPISWSAQVSDPALSVADASGVSSGTLEAGETEILYVTVKGGALAGAGTVTVTTGDGQQDTVPVTWISLPVL